MNLKQYAEKHSQKALADLIGESPSFVNQWIRLDRPVPIPTCVLIEQRTGGVVTRRELRPKDWHAIWPELITADDVAATATTTPTEPAAAGV